MVAVVHLIRNMAEYAAAESPVMNGHDESNTSSSTDTSPGKPLTTPKGPAEPERQALGQLCQGKA